MNIYSICKILSINNIEIWRDIEGYEGYYEISNLGNIKSLGNYKGGKIRILKPSLRNGYYSIELHKNKDKKRFSIHRLVAIHFLKRIPNKDIVNHLDCNKLFNVVHNLEWCTISENTKHSYENGCQPITDKMRNVRRENIKTANKTQFKKVVCIETNTIYENIIEAARDVGLKGSSSIIRACKNPNKTAAKFHWKYVQ